MVRDTGKGISREFLPCIFERFRQEETGESRRASGLGLGLAIVRHLVELHRGRPAAALRSVQVLAGGTMRAHVAVFRAFALHGPWTGCKVVGISNSKEHEVTLREEWLSAGATLPTMWKQEVAVA